MKPLGWLCVGMGLLVASATACSGDDDEGGSSGGPGGSGGSAGSTGGTAGSTGGSAGSTGGSGGGSSSQCEPACTKITAANCPNEDEQAKCVSDCDADIVGSTTCGTEGSAIVDCVATTAIVTCDGEGEAWFEGCESQLQAWMVCSACDADDEDDGCATCQKTKCCTELKDFAADPDFIAIQQCLDPCTNEACVNACIAQYSTAADKLGAYIDCMENSCGTECA